MNNVKTRKDKLPLTVKEMHNNGSISALTHPTVFQTNKNPILRLLGATIIPAHRIQATIAAYHQCRMNRENRIALNLFPTEPTVKTVKLGEGIVAPVEGVRKEVIMYDFFSMDANKATVGAGGTQAAAYNTGVARQPTFGPFSYMDTEASRVPEPCKTVFVDYMSASRDPPESEPIWKEITVDEGKNCCFCGKIYAPMWSRVDPSQGLCYDCELGPPRAG